jgi:6-phosphogluconolactonase
MSAPKTHVYVSTAGAGEVACFELTSNGQLQAHGSAIAGPLVMPMAATRDGQRLHAAVRSQPFRLCSFAIQADSGRLTPEPPVSLADNMVYIALDRTERWMVCASYSGNTVAVHPVQDNGRVSPTPTCFFPTGGNKPHAIAIAPNNRFVYVPHLGSDELHIYPLDAATGMLDASSVRSIQLPLNFGPRHLVFSQDGRFLYLLGEMSGLIAVFECNATTGDLRLTQTLSTLPSDTPLQPGIPRVPSGVNETASVDLSTMIWCADLLITPDGRHLYTTERTRDHISCLSIDPLSGQLQLLGQTSTERQPRGIACDPEGRYLISSGEHADHLSLFRRDAATGGLEWVQRVPIGTGANWIQVVRVT